MATQEVTTEVTAQARARGRRTLMLIALVAMAPIIASYAAYYLFPRDKQVNYGELLPTRPPPDAAIVAEFKGRWVLLTADPAACNAQCQAALYGMRQARTIQGREMPRVVRVWLVTDDAAPAPALLAEHPDLVIRRGTLSSWPAGAERIYLVDPLGNVVLAWPRDPDIKKMSTDIGRLLKASRIG